MKEYFVSKLLFVPDEIQFKVFDIILRTKFKGNLDYKFYEK